MRSVRSTSNSIRLSPRNQGSKSYQTDDFASVVKHINNLNKHVTVLEGKLVTRIERVKVMSIWLAVEPLNWQRNNEALSNLQSHPTGAYVAV